MEIKLKDFIELFDDNKCIYICDETLSERWYYYKNKDQIDKRYLRLRYKVIKFDISAETKMANDRLAVDIIPCIKSKDCLNCYILFN